MKESNKYTFKGLLWRLLAFAFLFGVFFALSGGDVLLTIAAFLGFIFFAITNERAGQYYRTAQTHKVNELMEKEIKE
jgi:hypothetical protein